MESVGGRYINATLNLFHGRGQSHHHGTAFLQTFPAQGPGPRWLNYEGLGACLALPKVARQPLPNGRQDGLDLSPAQEQGCRPSNQKSQGVNTIVLTLGIWQPFLPQHLLGKRQWASARVWTRRPGTPPPKVWITAWPPRCGGTPQTTLLHVGGASGGAIVMVKHSSKY
jgi:hypothetical protein